MCVDKQEIEVVEGKESHFMHGRQQCAADVDTSFVVECWLICWLWVL